MRTRVKFCGLVRATDIDMAVSLGVDAIGFVFYPRSPRYLTPDEAASLRRRLPSWVSAVGLFVNETAAHCNAVADQVGLDVIQAHGDERPDDLAALRRPCWKALRIGVSEAHAAPECGRVMADRSAVREALALFGHAECCLVDAASPGFGGSGHAFDWSVLPEPGSGHRLILAGGLRPDSVAQAIASVAPFAVDVSSGIQGGSAREKDVGKMTDFMAAVLSADSGRRGVHAVGN